MMSRTIRWLLNIRPKSPEDCIALDRIDSDHLNNWLLFGKNIINF